MPARSRRLLDIPDRLGGSIRRGLLNLGTAALACAAVSSCGESPSAIEPDGVMERRGPPPHPDPADTRFLPGGSNYVMYSIGDYLEDQSFENWMAPYPYTLRPAIGTYHMDPDEVRRQLAEMHASGQRRIALVLWHANFWWDPSYAQREVRGHVVNSAFGEINERHQQNLRLLIGDIGDAGFEELVFRFASQWSSDPRGWPSWQETRYQRNWGVIRQVKTTVDEVAGHYGLPVLYDLELELGGLGRGERQVRSYARRLWEDYTTLYGTDHTIGFSVVLEPGRMTRALEDYDAVGVRPSFHGVDVYRNEYRSLKRLHEEFSAADEAGTRIIMQEVHYNDETSAAEIAEARMDFGLNIAYVLQWPYSRELRHIPHFSVHYPREFDAYLSVLQPTTP